MTFCRRGNDYADVAQPFHLTGGSHGGDNDTTDVASPTGDRRAPPPARPLPHPTLLLVLSLAFSWMVEKVMEECLNQHWRHYLQIILWPETTKPNSKNIVIHDVWSKIIVIIIIYQPFVSHHVAQNLIY